MDMQNVSHIVVKVKAHVRLLKIRIMRFYKKYAEIAAVSSPSIKSVVFIQRQ
jgi:hypothetical protein